MNPIPGMPLAGVLAGADPLSHVLDRKMIGDQFTWHMLLVTVTAILCVTILPLAARRIQADGTGGRLGGFFESILLFIRDEVARPFLGKEGDRYLWILWTFFFFILFCNLLGMVPGGASATGNWNVTVALSITSFVIYNGVGIRQNGLVKFLKGTFLVGPPALWPLMIVIETAGVIIKPVALTLRLAANMFAGHIMLAVIVGFGVFGWYIAVISTTAGVLISFLEIFVAFLQAFIFTFLTTVFLSMAIHPDH